MVFLGYIGIPGAASWNIKNNFPYSGANTVHGNDKVTFAFIVTGSIFSRSRNLIPLFSETYDWKRPFPQPLPKPFRMTNTNYELWIWFEFCTLHFSFCILLLYSSSARGQARCRHLNVALITCEDTSSPPFAQPGHRTSTAALTEATSPRYNSSDILLHNFFITINSTLAALTIASDAHHGGKTPWFNHSNASDVLSFIRVSPFSSIYVLTVFFLPDISASRFSTMFYIPELRLHHLQCKPSKFTKAHHINDVDMRCLSASFAA